MRPEALKAFKADTIVLVKIRDSKKLSSQFEWTATGAVLGRLFGSYDKSKIVFANEDIVTCHSMGRPTVGRYYVLYLERTNDGLRYSAGFPFWFARASGDHRLRKLDRIMPLGTARRPTTEEQSLIDFAEPRLIEKTGIRDLSNYTRVYGRNSASGVSALLIRSGFSRRLIVDDPAEFPTAASCRCKPVQVYIDLNDLWNAGKLPIFDPQ